MLWKAIMWVLDMSYVILLSLGVIRHCVRLFKLCGLAQITYSNVGKGELGTSRLEIG